MAVVIVESSSRRSARSDKSRSCRGFSFFFFNRFLTPSCIYVYAFYFFVTPLLWESAHKSNLGIFFKLLLLETLYSCNMWVNAIKCTTTLAAHPSPPHPTPPPGPPTHPPTLPPTLPRPEQSSRWETVHSSHGWARLNPHQPSTTAPPPPTATTQTMCPCTEHCYISCILFKKKSWQILVFLL